MLKCVFKLKLIIAVEIGQITCILLKRSLNTLLNIDWKHITSRFPYMGDSMLLLVVKCYVIIMRKYRGSRAQK